MILFPLYRQIFPWINLEFLEFPRNGIGDDQMGAGGYRYPSINSQQQAGLF